MNHSLGKIELYVFDTFLLYRLMKISRINDTIFVQLHLFDIMVFQVLFTILAILPVLTVVSIFI